MSSSMDMANLNAMIQSMMWRQMATDLQPSYKLYNAATPRIGGMLGLEGYDQVNPEEIIAQTPGYQGMFDQGLEAIDRAAAARGMLGSGPVAKQLMKYGGTQFQNMAYNPYMNSLFNSMNAGQNAVTGVGNAGMNMASNVGNAFMQAGQQQDQMDYYNSQNKGGGWLDTIAGGAGLLGGILMSPKSSMNNSVLGSALGWAM